VNIVLLYFHLKISRLNLVYCLTMCIILQAAYVLYKDFQILFSSRLVSFSNLCKNFVLNQQLNLTDYSKRCQLCSSDEFNLHIIFIFSLVFIDLPVEISKFKYFSFSMMTRL
jgi:hypothetical protein